MLVNSYSFNTIITYEISSFASPISDSSIKEISSQEAENDYGVKFTCYKKSVLLLGNQSKEIGHYSLHWSASFNGSQYYWLSDLWTITNSHDVKILSIKKA